MIAAEVAEAEAEETAHHSEVEGEETVHHFEGVEVEKLANLLPFTREFSL